jgi:hypothetical protein
MDRVFDIVQQIPRGGIKRLVRFPDPIEHLIREFCGGTKISRNELIYSALIFAIREHYEAIKGESFWLDKCRAEFGIMYKENQNEKR